MDPLNRAQVLLLCDLCQKAALQSHCELCQINLCIICVGNHLSDSSKRHNVVPYNHRTSTPNYPNCQNHTQKHCELYCEECGIPVCSTCISSGIHHGHKIADVLKKLSYKTQKIAKDLEELEKKIYPLYEKVSLELNSGRNNLEKRYSKMTKAVIKQGEDWHREIDIIVNKQKSEIDEMKSKHLAALEKQEREIKQITSKVKQRILYLKEILDTSDFFKTSAYKSRNAEFRSLPPNVNVVFPSFLPRQINKRQLHQMFGFLSPLTITKDEHCYTIETPDTFSCPIDKPLLVEPKLIATIVSDYRNLTSVKCLSDKEIWIGGNEKFMKLYDLHGKLLQSIKTKSGCDPHDIAVTRSGDLVYTDPGTRTVNIVKNKQIQEMIKLQRWVPYQVCSTSSGDLLVTMDSADDKQSKVVRYSGSSEKQTIQFDSTGKPLFSPHFPKYNIENRNLDICVADCEANAVVVVNQAGKLRFRYTGHLSTTTRSFNPHGITTDSHSQILIAEIFDHRIHIINQDGQFLRYIDNCDLDIPWGLCVDTRDNLFVAEYDSGKVKKIKYM